MTTKTKAKYEVVYHASMADEEVLATYSTGQDAEDELARLRAKCDRGGMDADASDLSVRLAETTKAGHTPGAWVASTIGPGEPWHILDHGRVAHCRCPAIVASLESDGLIPAEQRTANARLIAASPDLLAACEFGSSMAMHPLVAAANMLRVRQPQLAAALRDMHTAITAAIRLARGE